MSKEKKLTILSPTRRQLIAGAGVAIGSLAGSRVWAKPQEKEKGKEQMTEEQSTGVEGLLTYLHQEIDLHASPLRIYDILLDSKQFAAVTGMPAQISHDVGGTFTTFGGLIEGRNIELVPSRRIVQAWRPANWDAGVYSLVKFELKERASQTRIILDHTGFPEGNFRHLDSGWYERYWEPLRKFIA